MCCGILDDVGHISDDIVHIGSTVVLAMNSVRKGLLVSKKKMVV